METHCRIETDFFHPLTVRLYPAVRRPKGVLGYALEVAFVLLSPPLDREVHHRLVVARPLLGYVVLGTVEQHLVVLILKYHKHV